MYRYLSIIETRKQTIRTRQFNEAFQPKHMRQNLSSVCFVAHYVVRSGTQLEKNPLFYCVRVFRTWLHVAVHTSIHTYCEIPSHFRSDIRDFFLAEHVLEVLIILDIHKNNTFEWVMAATKLINCRLIMTANELLMTSCVFLSAKPFLKIKVVRLSPGLKFNWLPSSYIQCKTLISFMISKPFLEQIKHATSAVALLKFQRWLSPQIIFSRYRSIEHI